MATNTSRHGWPFKSQAYTPRTLDEAMRDVVQPAANGYREGVIMTTFEECAPISDEAWTRLLGLTTPSTP